MHAENNIYLTAPAEILKSQWFSSLKDKLQLSVSRTIGDTCNLIVRNPEQESTHNQFKNCRYIIPVLGKLEEDDAEYAAELEEIAQFLNTRYEEEKIPGHLYKLLLAASSEVKQPELFQPICGINFFEHQKRKNSTAIYSFENQEHSITAWKLLLDLAYDIKTNYENYNAGGETSGKIKAAYLSLCSSDAWLMRNEIKRELHQLGYQVYPKIDLTYKLDRMEEKMSGMLDRCEFIIQIIGGGYGQIIEGKRISVIEKESNTISAYLESGNRAKRLIWIPETNARRESKLDLMVNKISLSKAITNTEIIKAPIDEFKDLLIQNLNTGLKKKVSNNKLPMLYLIHDADTDIAKVHDLVDTDQIHFVSLNYADQQNLYKDHLANLIKADHVLIMHTNNDEFWLKSKLSDLVKAPGMGRKGAFASYGIIVDNNLPDLTHVSHWLSELKIINLDDQKEITRFLNNIIE